MFHVFQVVSLGFSRNFSKFQNLHREEVRNFPISLSLYKKLEPIWVESSEGHKYIILYTMTRTSLF